MIIAFTGHRPNKLNNEWTHQGYMSTALAARIMARLDMDNPEYIISGMALGVDTIAALVAIARGIPFVAAVPFKGQETAWPAHNQAQYHRILAKAKHVQIVCPGGYAAWKMQVRNEWMVNELQGADDYLFAIHDGSPGGTNNCIEYARKKEKRIFTINPKLILPQTV